MPFLSGSKLTRLLPAVVVAVGAATWWNPTSGLADDPPQLSGTSVPDFTFVRLVYSGGNWRGSGWDTDYPKADIQLLYALRKLTDFSFINENHKALTLFTDEIYQYPFLYAVEVGYMDLGGEEADRLREYLLRGGFLLVDDFHGDYEWQRFYTQLKKVFPEYEPEDLPLDHPVFHCYFDIHETFQVPGIQFLYTGRTWEKGGRVPRYMGVHDESGRLMVAIIFNSDFGDAWEWAEVEAYPRRYANMAFQLAVNYIVYAMTH